MPRDELATRRRGIRVGGWVVIPPVSDDKPALAGYVIEVRGTEVIIDVPIDGGGWARAVAPLDRVSWCAPSWIDAGPTGGEAA